MSDTCVGVRPTRTPWASSASAFAAAVGLVHLIPGQPADVDQEVGLLDAQPHEIDEVRAAGERPGARRPRQQGDRAGGVSRALVAKRLHPATSRIAGTMFA